MPLYEYRCEACEARFDVLTSFASREAARVCPVCASERTRVLVSTFAAPSSGESLPVLNSGGGGCCGGSCGCGSAG